MERSEIKLDDLISGESFKGELCLTKDNPPVACKFPYMLSATETSTCTYQDGILKCPTMLDKFRKPIEGSWRECKDNCGSGVRYDRKWNFILISLIATFIEFQEIQGFELYLLITLVGVVTFDAMYLSSTSIIRVLHKIKIKLHKKPNEHDITDIIKMDHRFPHATDGKCIYN